MTAAPHLVSDRIEVVEADDRHADALAEFYRNVWDPEATGAGVRAARRAAANNPVTPGQVPPTFICLRNERVIGFVTTIPIRINACGAERIGHWVKGLMVSPEHRNGPVGMLVLREAIRRLGLAGAMVVQPAPRRLFEALGFTDVGVIPNHVHALRPNRILRALAASDLPGSPAGRAASLLRAGRFPPIAWFAHLTARAATRAWTAFSEPTLRSAGVTRCSTEAPPEDELDALWQRARAGIGAGSSRDGASLRWRYGSGGPYHWVTVRSPLGLTGVALLRPPRERGDPRLHGIRVATVSDILFHPSDAGTGLALLAGAERGARALGADAVLCSATHRRLHGVLRRRAFVPIPGNVHFLLRDPDGPRASVPPIEDWWLTRGDSNADEVF